MLDYHIFLDLDGTLLFKQNNQIIYRPYWKDFLIWCKQNFISISIWSANNKSYINEIVSYFNSSIEELEFRYIIDQSRCTLQYNQSFSSYKIIKKLSKIWKQDMNKYNTIIVDDTETTFEQNRSNGILISSFMGDKNDTGLIDIRSKILDRCKI